MTGARLRDVSARLRPHLGLLIESICAVGPVVFLLSLAPIRAVSYGFLVAWFQAFASAMRLLPVDPLGVLVTGGLTLLKVALLLAPVIRLWWRVRRRHFVWMPLNAMLLVLAFPLLYPAISTLFMWFLLAAASALAWWCVGRRHPAFRIALILPLLVTLRPLFLHAPLTHLVWSRRALAKRCQENDGVRPEGFHPSMARSRYFSVMRYSKDLLFLSGEQSSSWWLRRVEGTDRYRFEKRSALKGNLWEGCLWGDSIWFTARGRIVRMTRLPDGQPHHEQLEEFRIPTHGELDFVDPICDIDGGRILASELLGGRLHTLRLRDRHVSSSHLLNGINVQLVRRRDGQVVGIDMSRLFVYDPRRERITETHAAGILVMGVDVCAVDDAVVLADMAGRVRLFERGAGGRYRYLRGTFAQAPRRVAFSPDCTHIGVTSGDDRTVLLLRRRDLALVKRYRVGPGLRDITFIDSQQMAVADACTVTFLHINR